MLLYFKQRGAAIPLKKEVDMAKSKKKKKSALGYIMLAVVLIFAILAVVGIFLNWISVETIADDWLDRDPNGSEGFTLSTFDTMAEEYGLETEVIQSLRAVGYLAVAAVAVVFVAYVVKQLFSIGLFRVIVIIAGIATAAIGVAAIVYTSVQTQDWDIVLVRLVPGIGCYLTGIGAIGGGLAAAIGCFKK